VNKSYLCFVFTLLCSGLLLADDKYELSESSIEQLQLLQKGKLNQLQKLKLADQLQKEGAKKESLALFEENLSLRQISPDIPKEAYINYGTALLEAGAGTKGLAIYDAVMETLNTENEKDKKLKEMIENNITSFFQEQERKEEQKKQQEKDKKENKNKDKKEGQGTGKPERNDPSQGQSQNNDQGETPEDQNDKQESGADQKDNDDKKNESKSEPDQSKEKENLPPKKTPAKLKQLMSDDRQLQLRMIEQGTKDLNRRQSRENKDW
jgi:Ca-activated chloride channel homolog